MSKSLLMLDGHLGRISVMMHPIRLPKETFPKHSLPRRARRFQIQLERDEVDKVLKDNVAKEATTE